MSRRDDYTDVEVISSAQAGLAALQHASRGDEVSAIQVAMAAPDHFSVLSQVLTTAGYVIRCTGEQGERFLAQQLQNFAELTAWAEVHQPPKKGHHGD